MLAVSELSCVFHRRGHFLEDLTGDAIDLATALEASVPEVWSNDRHRLGATKHFGLRGRSVWPAMAVPAPAPPSAPKRWSGLRCILFSTGPIIRVPN